MASAGNDSPMVSDSDSSSMHDDDGRGSDDDGSSQYDGSSSGPPSGSEAGGDGEYDSDPYADDSDDRHDPAMHHEERFWAVKEDELKALAASANAMLAEVDVEVSPEVLHTNIRLGANDHSARMSVRIGPRYKLPSETGQMWGVDVSKPLHIDFWFPPSLMTRESTPRVAAVSQTVASEDGVVKDAPCGISYLIASNITEKLLKDYNLCSGGEWDGVLARQVSTGTQRSTDSTPASGGAGGAGGSSSSAAVAPLPVGEPLPLSAQEVQLMGILEVDESTARAIMAYPPEGKLTAEEIIDVLFSMSADDRALAIASSVTQLHEAELCGGMPGAPPPLVRRVSSTIGTRVASDEEIALARGGNVFARVIHFVDEALRNCTRNCMICGRKLPMRGLKPTICSDDLCQYQFVDKNLGLDLPAELRIRRRIIDLRLTFLHAAMDNPSRIAIAFPFEVRATVRGEDGKETQESFKHEGAAEVRDTTPSASSAGDKGTEADPWVMEMIAAAKAKGKPNVDRLRACFAAIPALDDLARVLAAPAREFAAWESGTGTAARASVPNSEMEQLVRFMSKTRSDVLGDPLRYSSLATPTCGGDPLAVPLLRWVVGNSRSHIRELKPEEFVTQKDGSSIGATQQFIMLTGDLDAEARFQANKSLHGSYFAWHGSNLSNWAAILVMGLQNMSGTSLMTNGAARGAGIYISDDLSFSHKYSTGGNYRRASGSWWPRSGLEQSVVVALCEVADGKEHAESISTVARADQIATRFLMLFKPGAPKSIRARDCVPPKLAGVI